MSVVEHKIVAKLSDGKWLAWAKVQLVNTSTVTADVEATITLPNISFIESVIGVDRLDTNNSGVVAKEVPVRSIYVKAQSVPAGATTYVKVSYVGV